MVPRFRIWKWPMWGIASASSGAAVATTASCSADRLPRHRSDREPFSVSTDELQRRNPVQIDEMVKARQPQCEHRHQTLPTAENLGVVPEFRKQRDRLIEARRRVVLESGWLHVVCTFRVLRSNETVGALRRRIQTSSAKRIRNEIVASWFVSSRWKALTDSTTEVRDDERRDCRGRSFRRRPHAAQGRSPPSERARPLRRRRGSFPGWVTWPS